MPLAHPRLLFTPDVWRACILTTARRTDPFENIIKCTRNAGDFSISYTPNQHRNLTIFILIIPISAIITIFNTRARTHQNRHIAGLHRPRTALAFQKPRIQTPRPREEKQRRKAAPATRGGGGAILISDARYAVLEQASSPRAPDNNSSVEPH
ncbi:hypothetical protein PG991_008243 [Apiospora marii]|uniref:Uncharacterized protein n=1 Tax=Apiospora marii TaxID=335849 RepID=A0ABR1RQQ6_9PEZI